jgi:hypothetical protein
LRRGLAAGFGFSRDDLAPRSRTRNVGRRNRACWSPRRAGGASALRAAVPPALRLLLVADAPAYARAWRHTPSCKRLPETRNARAPMTSPAGPATRPRGGAAAVAPGRGRTSRRRR